MEKIKVKQEWQTMLSSHQSRLSDLQQIVNVLSESGLTATDGDLKDLINNGTALYDQAEQAAKSNAGLFKLPSAKKKFIDENIAEMSAVIDGVKTDLIRILNINGSKPLSIEAYNIAKGKASISDEWVSELKEQYTIYESDERTKALGLMKEVKTAIGNLNAFVSKNQNFGTGVTGSQDNRRSLMWIDGNGILHEDIENLEFI